MFEVNESPLDRGLVTANTNPYRGDNQAYINKAENNMSAFTADIVKTRNRLQEKNPDLVREIQEVYNLYYGLFLLPPNMELDHLPDAEKTMAARVGHNITHHVMYSSQPEAEEGFIVGVYRATAMMQEVASQFLNNQQDCAFAKFWSGIKSELAVVRVLSTVGCQVWLPEYTVCFDPKLDETFQFDVRSGVDIIAQFNNRVFLVDAKGRAELPVPEISHRKISDSELTNLLLRRTVGGLKPESIYRTKVVIPSRECGYLNQQSVSGNTRVYQEQLSKLGRLPDSITKSIIQALDLK
ncbi:hypothetical protein COT44_00220 [Candidatus Shapirobacteria bacterium CG08_land_8_20_14_0_20_39_18]|uniref:Uncharacterized protein n=1 Tax=Candidatus Shapirobacteria bacterium CG08_land_8_20_14_0_20_39_18 TaxID=1974883 RepID=A0A2M6XE75_9BACT|nr:MAG: hypothetical protein COT44_00220 [Candidatus Shapirobacteria bacterium CG08_land_8_20_14_0_20_39_18]PIY64693.1 MAG: hypothetical protein COY91_04460 [Candidatus Shapirobacteria bacterium CG_4_10_14_0_8_um_filter_39_15]